jgi:hypothetical protein
LTTKYSQGDFIMEIIIGILFVGVIAYLLIQKRRPDDSAHPLDGATKPKASWPFPGGEVGEGKIHVKVADVAPVAPAPVAPVLTVDGHGDVQEVKPVKKAPAKKTADKKPAVKKAPAKKKSAE